MSAPIATARTTRNRKLECESCGYIVRTSRANLRRGFPICPCGTRMAPVELDDVLEFMDGPALEAHPVYQAYMTQVNSVAHGQAPHGIRGRALRDPQDVAAARIHSWLRETAAQTRLNAIRKADEDAIPF